MPLPSDQDMEKIRQMWQWYRTRMRSQDAAAAVASTGSVGSQDTQIVRVTGAPTGDRYPGFVQEYDSLAESYVDQGACWVVEIDGVSLAARPYLGLSVGSDVDDVPVYATAYWTSPLTTKGDILAFDTADDRLPAGADGKSLQADSAQSFGLGYSTRDFDGGGHKATNYADPVSAQDLVTLGYLQLRLDELSTKFDCEVATDGILPGTYVYANGSSGVGATLTAPSAAVLTLDTTYLVKLGDRVLVKNQANHAHNGIYSVTTLGTALVKTVLTRTTDFDEAIDGINGALVFVLNGTQGANTLWSCTVDATIVFGTTNINWFQFTGSSYTADETTIHLSGTTFSMLSTYVGQTSIVNVGVLVVGTWQATVIDSAYGGTGVNNGGRTLTISTNGGTLVFAGAGRTVTLPDADITVARTDAANSFTGDQTFLDLVKLRVGTTGKASLNIPIGVRPTSPNAGDMYFTVLGLFVYTGSVWLNCLDHTLLFNLQWDLCEHFALAGHFPSLAGFDGAGATAYYPVPVVKGNLLTYSTTQLLLGVGADGKVFQADSAQAAGLGYSTRDFDGGGFKALNYATAAVDTNTTQLATTAFVLAQAASATPLLESGAGAVGTSTRYARGDHVHPLSTAAITTSQLPGAQSVTFGGTITGVPAVPTWYKVTVTAANLSVNATTNTVTLCNVPAGTIVHAAKQKPSLLFTGTGIVAYTIQVGCGASNGKYLSAYDVHTTPVGGANYQYTVGNSLSNDANAPSASAATNLTVTGGSSGANLNAASIAGSDDIWLQLSTAV